jgi:hypothetical protein
MMVAILNIRVVHSCQRNRLSAAVTRALSEGESWRGFAQWHVAGFKTCTRGNLPELTKKENAGSDHAAFWVDLDI